MTGVQTCALPIWSAKLRARLHQVDSLAQVEDIFADYLQNRQMYLDAEVPDDMPEPVLQETER